MLIFVYILAFLKYVIYGLSVFFTGELSASTDVLDILSLRFLMSTAVLWVLKTTKILKIGVGARDIFRREGRPLHLGNLLLAALFEPILYMLFETLGVSMTTGITAGVILSLNPVAGCLAESIFLKEKTTTAQKIFLALGILGVIYIAMNTESTDGKDSPIGILFMILAVLVGALYLTFSRKSSASFSAIEITYISSFLGMAVFNSVNIVRHLFAGNITSYFAPYLSLDNLIGFFFLAVISTILATGMNNFCMSRMQVSTMSAFGGVSTIVTIAVSVLIGSETLYPFHLIGMALILTRMIGVSVIQIRRDKAAAKAVKHE